MDCVALHTLAQGVSVFLAFLGFGVMCWLLVRA